MRRHPDVDRDFARSELPSVDVLLANAKNLLREKWDWALPQPLRQKSYTSLNLSLVKAIARLLQLASTHGVAGESSASLSDGMDGAGTFSTT